MNNVIEFPGRHRGPALKKIGSFADFTPTDSSIDERANDLLAQAQETVSRFDSRAVAQMLAYAAARLERTGFNMFPDS